MKRFFLHFSLLLLFLFCLAPFCEAEGTEWVNVKNNFLEKKTMSIDMSVTFLYKKINQKFNILLKITGNIDKQDMTNPKTEAFVQVIFKNLLRNENISITGKLKIVNNGFFLKLTNLAVEGNDVSQESIIKIQEILQSYRGKWYKIIPENFLTHVNQENDIFTQKISNFYEYIFKNFEFLKTRHGFEGIKIKNKEIISYIFVFRRDLFAEHYEAIKKNIFQSQNKNLISLIRIHPEVKKNIEKIRYFNWFIIKENEIERLRGIFKYDDTPDLLSILSYNIHFSNYDKEFNINEPKAFSDFPSF